MRIPAIGHAVIFQDVDGDPFVAKVVGTSDPSEAEAVLLLEYTKKNGEKIRVANVEHSPIPQNGTWRWARED